MAKADPGSGPASLFEVSTKLQSKVKLFRELIEKKKLEVRSVSKEMRNLIEKKEEELIRELDAIWEEMRTRMQSTKSEVEEEMTEVSEGINPLDDISEKHNSVKRELDFDIPSLILKWRVDELKDCIDTMCRCEQQLLVYNKDPWYRLKWSKCEEGNGNNQLLRPAGIAINPMNENIYVADRFNFKVKIFSREGEWIRTVKDDEMMYPNNILFHNNSIYVECLNAILKLNESTEKKEKSKSYDFPLSGICTDKICIYVGQSKEMNLIVLTLDLIEEKRISLKTEFCQQDTQISHICFSQDLFYILLFKAEFPIQAFSKEGILTRCVIEKYSLECASSFCLDQLLNILVADCGGSKVRIFSNEGKLLTQFGEKGSRDRQFSLLQGISLIQHDCIITTNYEKYQDKLQLFYHD